MKIDGSRLRKFAVTLVHAQNCGFFLTLAYFFHFLYFSSCVVPCRLGCLPQAIKQPEDYPDLGLFKILLDCSHWQEEQQCRVAKPRLVEFNRVPCKTCQVTDFMLGKLIQILLGSTEWVFHCLLLCICSYKGSCKERLWLGKGSWSWCFRLYQDPWQRQRSLLACCPCLYPSSALRLLTQEPARVVLVVHPRPPLTTAENCRIDDSKRVKVYVAHCIPRHHVRPHFYLCYPNMQDWFVCHSK